MAEIRPSFLSKFNTMLQLGLFFVLVGNPVWHLDTMLLQSLFNVDWAILDDLNVLEGGQFIVGGFTLATGIDYALTSRKVYRSHRQ